MKKEFISICLFLSTPVCRERERDGESCILVGFTLSLPMDRHAHLSLLFVCVIITVLDSFPCHPHSVMLVCPSSLAKASEIT